MGKPRIRVSENVRVQRKQSVWERIFWFLLAAVLFFIALGLIDQPTHQLFSTAKAMFRDAWDMKLSQSHEQRKVWQRKLKAAEKQTDDLLDRVVDATSPSVISAYEKKIERLERENIVLAEKVAETVPAKRRLEECMELSLKFLSSPWEIYEKGIYACGKLCLDWCL